MEGLTIDKINVLQADNDRLRKELASRNQILTPAGVFSVLEQTENFKALVELYKITEE